jgi:hypothetical protein
MQEAISSSLEDLDFPFDTECNVGVQDGRTAFLLLDLPEIEDVIPETRFQVLKSGRLKLVKRKAEDRQLRYARLVLGLALMVAATAFAAAPTLETVTIGANIQRKRRGSLQVEDQYVYEACLPRALFVGDTVRSAEPVELLKGLARMEFGANFSLNTIVEPSWAAELRDPRVATSSAEVCGWVVDQLTGSMK